MISKKKSRRAMPSNSYDRRILSRPIGIRWAGWETDTQRLQRAGWKLAVETDAYREQYRLIMNHEQMRLTAMTDERKLEYALTQMQHTFRQDCFPIFEVRHVAPTFEFVKIQMGAFPDFQQIDAEPRMSTQEVKRLEDLNVFRLALDGAEEVIIDKADMSVIEHLQAIKDLQKETQRDLRQKARQSKPADSERGEVVVQLVDYK